MAVFGMVGVLLFGYCVGLATGRLIGRARWLDEGGRQ